MQAQKELLELAEEIKMCMKCHSPYEKVTTERSVFVRDLFLEGPWFFPPKGSVKGFLGTGPVMFVAERPATGKPFSSNKSGDTYFYCLLEDGFSHAHLTDLIKCRGKTSKENEKSSEYENCEGWLLKEMDLVKPKLIVALGAKAYSRLKKLNPNIPLEKIDHYGSIRRNRENREKIRKQLENVKLKVRQFPKS